MVFFLYIPQGDFSQLGSPSWGFLAHGFRWCLDGQVLLDRTRSEQYSQHTPATENEPAFLPSLNLEKKEFVLMQETFITTYYYFLIPSSSKQYKMHFWKVDQIGAQCVRMSWMSIFTSGFILYN